MPPWKVLNADTSITGLGIMDTEWDQLRTAAESAAQYGNHAEAAQYWLTALEKSISFSKYDPRRILTLENLGSTYWRLGQFADALPILLETFELNEDQLGPDHADIGALANNLAMLYHTLEYGKEAEEFYKRALRIRRKALGVEHPDVAELIKNYSNLLVSAGRAMEAEDLKASTVSVKTGVWNRSGHFKAIQIEAPEALHVVEEPIAPEPEADIRAISDDELKAESSQISNWLSARAKETAPAVEQPPKWVEEMAKGFQAVKENNTLQAEQHLRKALKATEYFDDNDPRITDTLEILSEVLWRNGKIAEAEPLCERTLKYYEGTLDPNHIDIGVIVNNLAMLYHALDKHEEAEPLYKRAISIRSTAQGTSHPDVVAVLNNYANLLYLTQRETEAVNLKNYVRSITSGKWNKVGQFKAMKPIDPNKPRDPNEPKENQFETFSRLNKPDLKKVKDVVPKTKTLAEVAAEERALFESM